jgi:DNA protecting protein DprA
MSSVPSLSAPPPEAGALASLPGMWWKPLSSLVASMDWREAWSLVSRGRHPADKQRRWQRGAREIEERGGPAALVGRWEQAGLQVLVEGFSGYPLALMGDRSRPPVLWAKGNAACLGSPEEPGTRKPTVAIVGTRSATRYGISVAAELGRELADRGVSVVSGLALGIDAAAHEGCLAASESRKQASVAMPGVPVAVVATGVDFVYPRNNQRTWERVARAGVILSEAPPGTPPERWRFPVRNRLIAALSQVVVVVECHEAGGSLFTVDEALERGIQVMAVPGSIYSPASKGTNHLLADGAALVRSVDDVMIALALGIRDDPSRRGFSLAMRSYSSRRSGSSSKGGAVGTPSRAKKESRAAAATAKRLSVPRAQESSGTPTVEESSVLAALGWEPASLETLSRDTGLGLVEVALAVERLVSSGLVVSSRGLVERA